MVKYSIVITTFNRLNLLKECLKHVLNQTKPFDHILLVNNASSDGTAEYLDKISLEYEHIYVYHQEKNIGGAGGFALGVKKALDFQDDYLLLIDDDAILDEKYMEYIDQCLKKMDYQYQAYSGTVYTHGKINYLHRYFIGQSIFFKMIPVSIKYYASEYFIYDISTFCGMVISLDVIRKIGIPEEAFFISYDDIEYSLRISKYTRFVNVNKAMLIHKEKTADKRYHWKRYYAYRNKIIIGMQNSKCKFLYACKISCLYMMRMGKCILKYYFRINKHDQIYIFIQYFDAWKDGIRGKLGISGKYYPK